MPETPIDVERLAAMGQAQPVDAAFEKIQMPVDRDAVGAGQRAGEGRRQRRHCLALRRRRTRQQKGRRNGHQNHHQNQTPHRPLPQTPWHQDMT